MKRELIVLLAVVTLTVAMVPRLRREVPEPTDKDEAADDTHKEICMKTTPCAWTVYKPKTKILDTQFDNTYCKCPPNESCLSPEENLTVDVINHFCGPA